VRSSGVAVVANADSVLLSVAGLAAAAAVAGVAVLVAVSRGAGGRKWHSSLHTLRLCLHQQWLMCCARLLCC
jgi:hypothetical protein